MVPVQSLKLFVLMLVVTVAAACAPAPEPKIVVSNDLLPLAVVIGEPTPVPGVALTYVEVHQLSVEYFNNGDKPRVYVSAVRQVLVDNTKKFAVGDTVKLAMLDYISSSNSSLQVIWTIAK